MEDYIIWLIVMVFFLLAEVFTMGLYTIWFVIGGAVALILSLFNVHIVFQVLAFFLVSILSLIFIYPMVKSKLSFAKTRTNAGALIEKVGIVIEEIDNFAPTGQVKVENQIWTARSFDDSKIDKGQKVKVLSIQGVKLIVTDKI